MVKRDDIGISQMMLASLKFSLTISVILICGWYVIIQKKHMVEIFKGIGLVPMDASGWV